MTHRLLFAIALSLGFVAASCTVSPRGTTDTGNGGGDIDTGNVVPGVDAWRDHGPGTTLIASDAPADAPTHFTGTPDPANAPELVYPDDGVMIPPNLETFELHFRPNGSTLFRMDLAISTGDVHVYFVCSEMVGGGCIYTPDHATWSAIQMATRGVSGVTWSVTGTDSAGRIGTSPTRSIQVASEDITGGVYYWNAAAGSIMRFEFGVPGAVEETYLRGGGPINCIGCHALSRDGSHIAVGRGIPTSQVQVYDVASRMMQYQNFRDTSGTAVMGRPDFFSFNPDGSQLVVSNPHGLNIADATGALTATGITTGVSTMPDWSPDGQHIVYVSVAGGGPAIEAPGCTSGSLSRIDLVGGTWTAGPVLADAAGANNYHPTYAPSGQWIVFNHSPSNANSFGDDTSSSSNGACVADAELWAVASDGSGTPFQLSNIGGTCSSWPKFDPTTYHDHGHDLFWVAWATARGYGLRYADGSIMQIWMAAFDPTLAGSGAPTHAAFRLPFQNIATGNHIAQWVTSVARMTCTNDSECAGEFCVDGRCYNQVPM